MPLELDFKPLISLSENHLDNILRGVSEAIRESINKLDVSTPDEVKEVFDSAQLKPVCDEVFRPMCMVFSEAENKHVLDKDLYIKELERALNHTCLVLKLFKKQTSNVENAVRNFEIKG